MEEECRKTERINQRKMRTKKTEIEKTRNIYLLFEVGRDENRPEEEVENKVDIESKYIYLVLNPKILLYIDCISFLCLFFIVDFFSVVYLFLSCFVPLFSRRYTSSLHRQLHILKILITKKIKTCYHRWYCVFTGGNLIS